MTHDNDLVSRAEVKPLVWTDPTPPNDECSYDHVFAESVLGRYSVEWKSWKSGDGRTVFRGGDFVSNEQTLDAAKAAAQADYESRIRAALTTEAGDGWRPIETAPQDGRDLLLYQAGWAINPVIVGRCQRGVWLSDCFEIDEQDQRPTHWRTLPAPPATEGEA